MQFRDLETGNYLTAVSSGCTTLESAAIWAETEYQRRLTERKQPENPRLLDFLISFWNPDSTYVKEKTQEGRVLSSEYILNNRAAIKKHLAPFPSFADSRLVELKPPVAKERLVHLGDIGVFPRMINITWHAIRIAVRC